VSEPDAQLAPCGNSACLPGQFCDWRIEMCGKPPYPDPGDCHDPGEACELDRPICGCDGELHLNECDAHAQGIDAYWEGACSSLDGWFRCGGKYCRRWLEICSLEPVDTGGGSSSCSPAFSCDGGPLCDCLIGPCTQNSFNASCYDDGQGAVTRACAF
jgi:hypothetical protein